MYLPRPRRHGRPDETLVLVTAPYRQHDGDDRHPPHARVERRRGPARQMFGRRAMIYAVECVHCQETLLTTAQVGDAEARIVADHLETRHPAVLDAAVDFDDLGLAEILHHVRVTNR